MILRLGDREVRNDNERKLYTRSGWEIPCKSIVAQHPDVVRIRSNVLAEAKTDGRELRSVSNYPYNCVGMIFAARRAWIEIDHIYDILEGDGYRTVPKEEAIEGDIVLYKDNHSQPTHIALIIQVIRYSSATMDIHVLSKWGEHGEFIHFFDKAAPFLGSPVAFYTERVI